jgi:hypothetical protein
MIHSSLIEKLPEESPSQNGTRTSTADRRGARPRRTIRQAFRWWRWKTAIFFHALREIYSQGFRRKVVAEDQVNEERLNKMLRDMGHEHLSEKHSKPLRKGG